ncbi:thioesterase family protein [Paracoccus siganidrum]|uniref:Thioesterase n=1 Tax=Paracoccus siganidrum TaxID=1276757 RepID=A0A419A6H4_9RHOB|nr:thioesterase family protein [Paracoccus siganidrum]RJL14492.1 thioesterase [Paracoccus siganidrum]RMC33984.1 thioesterase [Paracoccus siganidrum]
MKPGLAVGSTGRHALKIGDEHLVPALFGGVAFPNMPAVFATAQMVGLMEWACVAHLRPYYEAGEDSLGIHVDVDHGAPTLSGQTVTVETEVEEIDGRFVWFRVRAHDGVEVIGQGRHRRAVIDVAKFNDRLAAKRAVAGLEG